jgi:FKBP-type peptidyl-prolyl cis-trans isomerase 2
MSKAKEGSKVKVHYVGTLTDGTEFDNSRNREEGLEFTIDDGQLIKGFNDAVKGLAVGETTTVDIVAKEAYGDYVKEAVIKANKSEFPAEFIFQENAIVQGKDPKGQPIQGKIVEVREADVAIDMNHPLAGKDLKFEIELLELV